MARELTAGFDTVHNTPYALATTAGITACARTSSPGHHCRDHCTKSTGSLFPVKSTGIGSGHAPGSLLPAVITEPRLTCPSSSDRDRSVELTVTDPGRFRRPGSRSRSTRSCSDFSNRALKEHSFRYDVYSPHLRHRMHSWRRLLRSRLG